LYYIKLKLVFDYSTIHIVNKLPNGMYVARDRS